MAVVRETELYPPVKNFFEMRGCEVKAEVRGCDLVAVHPADQAMTIVEMKRIFTLPLLLQGVDRQRTGALVWLAVERNRAKRGAHNQRYHELTALCRRLRLGFMTVTFYKTKPPVVEVWCEPSIAVAMASATSPIGASGGLVGVPGMSIGTDGTSGADTVGVLGAAGADGAFVATSAADLAGTAAMVAAEAAATYGDDLGATPIARRSRKAAERLMREFAGRSGDYNTGGSTRRKLVTAYRERSLQCALALHCHGPSAPRQVRDWTGCANPGTLLRDNVYGWFARVEKGIYRLTPAGEQALRDYREVTEVWASRLPWAAHWDSSSESGTASQSDAERPRKS